MAPNFFLTLMKVTTHEDPTRIFDDAPVPYQPTKNMLFPGSQSGFPVLIETLPIWLIFGPLGHELAKVLKPAAKEHAENVKPCSGFPKYWYKNYYWYYSVSVAICMQQASRRAAAIPQNRQFVGTG